MRKFLSEALTNLGFYLISSVDEGYHILPKRKADNLYTNYRSKFFFVDGLRIHYRDEGEGIPIVLIHGFSGSLHLWDDWVDILSEDYRVIRFDLPGFGLSDLPGRDKLDIPNYLYYIKKLMDKLDLTKFHLVGNSFGGWLSWEFALKYPKMVDRLALISSAGYFSQMRPKTVELAQKPIFKQILKTGIPRFVVKRMLLNSYGDKTKVSEYDINRHYGLINREGNLISMMKIAASPIEVDPKSIRRITQPTLVMWGMLDKIIPFSDASKFYKDIKNSYLITYRGVGHIPHVEVPKKSTKDFIDFLDRDFSPF